MDLLILCLAEYRRLPKLKIKEKERQESNLEKVKKLGLEVVELDVNGNPLK
jgi:hypothetical protein